VSALRSEGKDVIGLHIGSPDLPPPDHVVDVLERSARNPAHHGYTGFIGTPGLREAIADYYERRFGVAFDPSSEVLPLIGSKEGIAHLALAYLDPGDVALIPDPGYPAYATGTVLAGGEPVWYPLQSENSFLPDLDRLNGAALERARILWVNYPNNPTGAVAGLEALSEIVAFALEHGLVLGYDNPYADVTFDGYRAHSIFEVDGAKEVAIEFNSLSKTWNMAGWRVGMAVASPEIVKALQNVKSNVDSGLFRVVCDAAEEAIRHTSPAWIEQRNAVYQERRDLIMDALPSIGLSAVPPKATLYVWARVEGGDDQAYVDGALDEAHVCVTPGSVYGPTGAGYVRISFVVSKDRLQEALQRLRDWHKTRS
jgi:LL-diaminopimelate aminotransferase